MADHLVALPTCLDLEDLVALPTCLDLEGLVNINVAVIARADYGDCKGALPKGFRKLLFRFSKLDLGLPSPHPLPEQAKDQQGLNDDQRDPGEEVFPALFPKRGFAKQDPGARRQSRLGDVPSAKLA